MKRIKFSNDIIKSKYIFVALLIILSFFFILYKLSYLIIEESKTYYENLSIKQSKTYISKYAPRGRILDRNGNILVDNEEIYTIIYLKKENVSELKEIELAKNVSSFLELNYEKITTENLKNYYYIMNKEKLESLANKNVIKKYNDRTISKNEYQSYLKKLITSEMIGAISLEDKKTAYLYSLMNKGYRNSFKLIKENITKEESLKIKEYFSDGFELSLNYERTYPYDSVFRDYLGNIGSIPLEELDHYLSLGYERDDKVGISYLEKEYENILKGYNEEYILTASGEKIITQELKNGEDLVLSLDIDLQKDIENIVYEEVKKSKKEPNTKYYNKSYVILSNPNTGEIYASIGTGVLNDKNYSKVDYLTDLTNYAITPGSIVKGASHLVGYKNNALEIGYSVKDGCIKIKNTPKKCSWKSLGKVNDLTALKYSSNYYQFLIAIKIGEGKYKYNSGLSLNTDGFKKYREIFNAFGLGVKTGLDIPNESVGYTGKDTNGGALLEYAIGQYETYTPMQLIQYINTLATSGKRHALHYNKNYETNLLNEVNIDPKYMNRVKEGLKLVMGSGGTGKSYVDIKYKAAGKTGTSQSFIDTNMDGKIDTETISSSFGAYMPYDNPKLSIVVLSPNVSDLSKKYTSNVNRRITRKVINLYFNKYNID